MVEVHHDRLILPRPPPFASRSGEPGHAAAYTPGVPTITVAVEIDAPLEVVWQHAADLSTHAEWMADAASIEFLGEQRHGVGTRMRVETRVGPLHTVDIMRVTEWIEPRRIGMRHQGLIGGVGTFELASLGERTRFTWREELHFPWYLGGPVVGTAAAPILKTIWRRNLAGLKQRIEGSHA